MGSPRANIRWERAVLELVFCAGLASGKLQRGEIMALASGMWSKQVVSIVK